MFVSFVGMARSTKSHKALTTIFTTHNLSLSGHKLPKCHLHCTTHLCNALPGNFLDSRELFSGTWRLFQTGEVLEEPAVRALTVLLTRLRVADGRCCWRRRRRAALGRACRGTSRCLCCPLHSGAATCTPTQAPTAAVPTLPLPSIPSPSPPVRCRISHRPHTRLGSCSYR